MSCKKVFISLPTQSVFQGRLCPSYPPPSWLLNGTRNVFRLVFQNVPDPIQEFPRNPDDRLGFAHPFAVFIKGRYHRRIFTNGNPRGFHQPSVRLIKRLLSSFATTFSGTRGFVKLGHPVPESNL